MGWRAAVCFCQEAVKSLVSRQKGSPSQVESHTVTKENVGMKREMMMMMKMVMVVLIVLNVLIVSLFG